MAWPRFLGIAASFLMLATLAACSGEVSSVRVGDQSVSPARQSPVATLDAIEAAAGGQVSGISGRGVYDPPPRVLAFAQGDPTPVPVESLDDGFEAYLENEARAAGDQLRESERAENAGEQASEGRDQGRRGAAEPEVDYPSRPQGE